MTSYGSDASWPSPLDPIPPSRSSVKLFAAHMTLGALVFLSGAAVMIYEFIAVRFLQRNFGSSLDVWAAEIAVCMGGLAVGYALGGAISTRVYARSDVTPWRFLGKALAAGGAAGFLIEPVADGIGEWLIHCSPSWWHPLVAASACSFIPLVALGTVLPQAVQIHVKHLDRAGSAVGWMAAVSTCGSIVGVLTVALVLLPRYGVREITWWTSGALFVLGVFTAIGGRLGCTKKAVILFFAFYTAMTLHADAAIIFEQYTMYHHILVEDNAGKRILWFDRAPQSTMSKRDPAEGGFEYTDFFHVPLVLYPTIEDVLFVGLGGGTGPKAFLKDYPNLRVDVVEIDPVVVQVARDFFYVPSSPRLTVTTADGRQFLRRVSKQYGAIIVDAYASGPYGAHIPFHLATREFFLVVRDRLLNGGSLVYNVIGVAGGLNDKLLSDMHTTLKDVFEQLFVYQAGSSLNTVFVAQKAEPVLTGTARSFFDQSWPAGPWLQCPTDPKELVNMAQLLLRQGTLRRQILPMRLTQISRLQSQPPKGKLLTDDYAPVDVGIQTPR